MKLADELRRMADSVQGATDEQRQLLRDASNDIHELTQRAINGEDVSGEMRHLRAQLSNVTVAGGIRAGNALLTRAAEILRGVILG